MESLAVANVPDQENRDSEIRELIFQDVRSDSVALGQLRQEWESYATASKLAAFRAIRSSISRTSNSFTRIGRRENEAAVPV